MAEAPTLDVNKEARRVLDESSLYREKFIDAIRTLSWVADPKLIQRVPLIRLAHPLDWKTKLLIASRKFISGFVIGAVGSLTHAVAVGGVGTLTSGGVLVAAGLAGVLGGLGLTSAKYIKETRTDRRIGKEVRKPETLRLEGYNDAQMEWLANIINIVMSIAKAANLDTHAALRHVYTSLQLIGDVPQEVAEFLLTISTVVEDGTARGGFTAEEIGRVLKEAADIKEAALRLQTLWDGR